MKQWRGEGGWGNSDTSSARKPLPPVGLETQREETLFPCLEPQWACAVGAWATKRKNYPLVAMGRSMGWMQSLLEMLLKQRMCGRNTLACLLSSSVLPRSLINSIWSEVWQLAEHVRNLCFSAVQNSMRKRDGMDIGSNRQMTTCYCMQMFTPTPLNCSCQCYP